MTTQGHAAAAASWAVPGTTQNVRGVLGGLEMICVNIKEPKVGYQSSVKSSAFSALTDWHFYRN